MVLTLVLTSVVNIILLIVLLKTIRSTANTAKQAIQSYITAPTSDDPSKLDLFVDKAAYIFNERLKASIKGSLMGSISGVKRNEKALERELVGMELSAQGGAAGDIFSMLPKKWQDKVIENPSLAQAVMNLLSRGGGGSVIPGNGNHSDYGAKVARWNR